MNALTEDSEMNGLWEKEAIRSVNLNLTFFTWENGLMVIQMHCIHFLQVIEEVETKILFINNYLINLWTFL